MLLVWSEYPPLRRILERFRELGGTALFGTSAKLSGEPIATTVREVWQSFALRGGLDELVADDFSDLPASRRQSTSIVDLTGRHPRLHRLGSVPPVELQRALRLNGFPPLQVGRGAFRLTA